MDSPASPSQLSMPKQRIDGLEIFVADVDWPMETYIERLLRELATRGAHLTIGSVHTADQAWLERNAAQSCYGTEPRSFRRHRSIRRMVQAGSGQSQSRGMLSSDIAQHAKAADVIYAPSIESLVERPDFFGLGVPVVTSCPSGSISIAPWNPKRPGYVKGLREAFERSAVVHFESDATANDAMTIGLRSDRVRVIRPAVDINEFAPKTCRIATADFRLVAVGSLSWRKDYETALRAIRLAIDSGVNCRLAIVGEGRDRDRIMFSRRDLGLEGHVQLLGALTPHGVRDHLHRSNAMFHTDTSQGISHAMLEAMACGLPVIATDVGGVSDAVTDQVDGRLFAPRDVRGAAGAIHSLATDRSGTLGLGRAARDRVVAKFNIVDQVDRFAHLLVNFSRSIR